MSPQLNRVIERLTERLTLPAEPRSISVTVRTAARMLDVSESTIKRAIRSGQIRSSRVRGRRVIAYESLRNLL
jgi:excisionase family DNA binding protein